MQWGTAGIPMLLGEMGARDRRLTWRLACTYPGLTQKAIEQEDTLPQNKGKDENRVLNGDP